MDGAVRIWSDSWDKPDLNLAKQKGQVAGLDVSPDGQRLACCYNKYRDREGNPGVGRLVLWDLKTGGLLHKLTADDRSINSALFSPDGQLLAYTIDADRGGASTLEIRDAKSWKSLESIEFSSGFSLRLVWSADGKKIVIAGGECVPTGPDGCQIVGHLWIAERGATKPADLVAKNPGAYFQDADSVGSGDRFVLATATAKFSVDKVGQITGWHSIGRLEIRGFKTGAIESAIELPGASFLYSVTGWRDGNLIAACDSTHQIHLVEFETAEVLEPIVLNVEK